MADVLDTLRAEVTADPLGRGYAGMNAKQLAASLNEVNRTVRRPVPIVDLSSFCATEGITGAVKALAEIPLGGQLAPGVTMDVPTKAALLTVEIILLTDYRLTTADTDSPKFAAACDGLIQLGCMSLEQKAALLALGDVTQSRADELGLPEVGPGIIFSAGLRNP